MKHNKQHVKPKATLNKDNFNATTEFNKNINYLFIYFAIFISTFLLYGWTYTFSWGMDEGLFASDHLCCKMIWLLQWL